MSCAAVKHGWLLCFIRAVRFTSVISVCKAIPIPERTMLCFGFYLFSYPCLLPRAALQGARVRCFTYIHSSHRVGLFWLGLFIMASFYFRSACWHLFASSFLWALTIRICCCFLLHYC